MRGKLVVFCLSALVLMGIVSWVSRGLAAAPEPATPPTARQNLELTVYAQDFGMVRELRPMQLAKGSNRLRVPDVSKALDPHSVLLRWQGDAPNPPQLVAHSYDLGVDSSDALLKRYLGKPVELVRYGQNGREADRQRGTLMVEADGAVVVQADGHFYVHPNGTLVAPANGDIVTIPQLSVQAESPAAQDANLEVAYLTRGLSWSADYVATLSPSSSTLVLECWATVTNHTGVDYPNASVSLMAGMPNRAAVPASRLREFESSDRTVLPAAPATPQRATQVASPEPVGDFHGYRLKHPTTVAQEQMNRLLMLASESVPITRGYSARLPALAAWDVGSSWATAGQPQRGSVQVALTFYNRAKSGLGVPLPQGAIRVYEPDRSRSLRYAGAATIAYTPRGKKVPLTLASAVDLFTEARIVKKQRLNKYTVRKQVEVVLHNEKPIPTNLRVVQGFGGRWKVVRESHQHVNLDAGTAQWRVKLPAGGKVTLGYTVDLTG